MHVTGKSAEKESEEMWLKKKKKTEMEKMKDLLSPSKEVTWFQMSK